MAHWKKFLDKELLGAWDLDGRDVTVTIVEVTGGELNNGTKKNKKPIATIASSSGRKLDKRLALNATNCKTIEQLAGSPDVDKWKGLRITLFPTTTQFGGETKECIRIRPYPPKDNAGRNGKMRDATPAPSGADAAAASETASPVIHPRDPDDDIPTGAEVGGADA
jgi:hypothetical protein